MLMDEPFSSLDAQTRLMMQELLSHVWHEYGMTVLFVTHDIDEAIYLGSRVAILTRRPGRLKTLLEIDLPRPRTADMIVSERFVELKRTCMDLMREETLSFGRRHQKSRRRARRAAPSIRRSQECCLNLGASIFLRGNARQVRNARVHLICADPRRPSAALLAIRSDYQLLSEDKAVYSGPCLEFELPLRCSRLRWRKLCLLVAGEIAAEGVRALAASGIPVQSSLYRRSRRM